MGWIWVVVCIFLTGRLEARQGFGPGDQEWGYVTVRPGAHMFWWLYYVNPPTEQVNVYQRPLLIWLQGGPGASSTGYGNFEELGPLDLELNTRNHTWVNDYSVLFIDNPVGSGYSYAESYAAFAKTNRQIADDLLECIRGFLAKLPEFSKVPVYITAESYGGKMAAELALVWFKAQSEGDIVSNLRGVALGDSWISPIDSVLSWAPYLLATGMIDSDGYKAIETAALETKRAVEKEEWVQATDLWGYTEAVIIRVTGNIDFYNILEKKSPRGLTSRFLPGVETRVDRDQMLGDLMNGAVKRALNVSTAWGRQSSRVFQILAGDFMKPVVDIVKQLKKETDLEVFVFTGQLDLIVSTPGTLVWVESMFEDVDEWHKASRDPVVVDNIIEGYVKTYRNFKMYWINRSGHMVPRDNPYATSAMLKHMTLISKP